MLFLVWPLAALVASSLVYSLIVVAAARDYLRPRPRSSAPALPVSILKPLAGNEEGLEENLRGYFKQRYPNFEILLAVRDPADPAAGIAQKLRAEFPHVPSRLLVTGEPPYPNAKVWSLARMTAEARHDLLAMADSDVCVSPDFLRSVAAEFERDPSLGVETCPYRAVPGSSFWSTIEAIGMNTEFLAGILVARLLEGMRFAVGPTIVARRRAIEAIGGWERVKDYLAEDFMLGRLAALAGLGVGLSSYVVEHRIGSQGFLANARHRLRWYRSTRRSRPVGYFGQLFTYPLPLALALIAAAPSWWPLALAAMAARAASAWAVFRTLLADPLCARRWWLIPVQDLASFAFWAGGFFGNSVTWRGRRYHLKADGRMEQTA